MKLNFNGYKHPFWSNNNNNNNPLSKLVDHTRKTNQQIGYEKGKK